MDTSTSKSTTAQPRPAGEERADSPQDANGATQPQDSRELPESPTDLSRRSWLGVLKRTFSEFRADNITDWAAALTYYGILAVFPAMIALVSILGLIGHSATQPLIDNLAKVAPGQAEQIVTNALHNIQRSQSTAGLLLILGIAGAVWSASSYIAAFMRASNAIYDVEEGRPVWMTIPIRVAVTCCCWALSPSAPGRGHHRRSGAGVSGTSSASVDRSELWDIAKWPVLLLVVSFMFSILYWASPNVRQAGWRWLSWGGVFAVVVWLIASGLFALYVSNFSAYNKTYGALAGIVIFLVWLWLSNVALLLGAELNAELLRGRHIEAGHPAEQEPFAEPRRAAKSD